MPIEHHHMNDVRRLFDVNFFGNVALTQAFMPLAREDKARIVFISSLAGRITQPKEGIYSASKSAVESLADALRQELYSHGVSVSLVEPGFVATPILGKVRWSAGGVCVYGLCYNISADVFPTHTHTHTHPIFGRSWTRRRWAT